MPSPFPGMNPFFEQPSRWQDFHQTFVGAMRTALIPNLPDRYLITLEEHVHIEVDAANQQPLGRPDALVAAMPFGAENGENSSVGVMAAPAKLRIPRLRKRRSPYLQIRTADDLRVVTVIEVLSPSNKTGRDGYLEKRWEVLSGAANFVELDLLRGGPRMPISKLPRCDYYALVSRPADRPTIDIWPVGLRDRLPVIPIPLDPNVAELSLDLQSVLHRIYDDSGYDRLIYRGEPEPPLAPVDRDWAMEVLAAAGS